MCVMKHCDYVNFDQLPIITKISMERGRFLTLLKNKCYV